MKIGIGNDHSAVDMKNEVVDYLKSLGHEVVNFGTDSYESCNYPVYGKAVAEAVRDKKVDCGICICGTGVGISLAGFVSGVYGDNLRRGILAAVIFPIALLVSLLLIKRRRSVEG